MNQTMERGLGLRWKIFLILGAVVLSFVLGAGIAYAVTFEAELYWNYGGGTYSGNAFTIASEVHYYLKVRCIGIEYWIGQPYLGWDTTNGQYLTWIVGDGGYASYHWIAGPGDILWWESHHYAYPGYDPPAYSAWKSHWEPHPKRFG